MVDVGCNPNYRTFNVLVKGLQRENQLLTEKVVGLVAQHEARCSSSSDKRCNFFEILCDLLARMSENECEPTIDTYGILVRGLCSDGKYDEADKLVEHMKEKGLCPNEEFYLPLFFAHCKNLKLDSALEIFGLMADRGFEVHLSAYTALICALCRANRMEEAITLFKNMLKNQWNADEIVWTILIDGLLKEGQSDPCMQLLHVIESQNCILSLETYADLARELSDVDKTIVISHIANRAIDLKDVH
ncbi:hypothetical protein M0R45_032739 [Rubus argutus]|uniref:Pentatricopeptide repeat-containing protein n=1 Tax=Rubus argutus TaxID=59490 RepID=A0AAW1WHQ8_RUBAR